MVANSHDDDEKKISSADSDAAAEPTKAVALKYRQGEDQAPTVVAKGRALIAEKIIEIATANGLPIHRDADLVEVLEKVELAQEIPLEVYTVVAEIFAYIYKANNARTQEPNL